MAKARENGMFNIQTEKEVSFAHIVDGSVKCGVIHGHNFVFVIEAISRTLVGGMVTDFTLLKKHIAELDHKLILSYRQVGDGNRVYANGKEYIIPREECAILEVEHTTAKEMAKYFAESIAEEYTNIVSITVKVYETERSLGSYTLMKPYEEKFNVRIEKKDEEVEKLYE